MQVEDKIKVPLIGDPDDIFLKKVFFDSRSELAPPEVVGSKPELEAKLKEDASRYSGIFLNPRLSDPHGVPLMRFIRERCPATPIYYIIDSSSQVTLSEIELKRLTVKEALRKPLSYSDIQKAVAASRHFDPEATLLMGMVM